MCYSSCLGSSLCVWLCCMDKYLCERIQIVLVLDELLCFREWSKFDASCEWFRLGWDSCSVASLFCGRHWKLVFRRPAGATTEPAEKGPVHLLSERSTGLRQELTSGPLSGPADAKGREERDAGSASRVPTIFQQGWLATGGVVFLPRGLEREVNHGYSMIRRSRERDFAKSQRSGGWIAPRNFLSGVAVEG